MSHDNRHIRIKPSAKPIDRNGNAPNFRLNLNTSNRFAEHINDLLRGKVAILSYDKRGVGKSTNHDKHLYYSAGMLDFVDDAVEAVRFVSTHPQM